MMLFRPVKKKGGTAAGLPRGEAQLPTRDQVSQNKMFQFFFLLFFVIILASPFFLLPLYVEFKHPLMDSFILCVFFQFCGRWMGSTLEEEKGGMGQVWSRRARDEIGASQRNQGWPGTPNHAI